MIQEAVGSEDELVDSAIRDAATWYFVLADVKGAIGAEVTENPEVPILLLPNDIVVKIESEDGENYLLYFAVRGRRLDIIWNYETMEQFWPN